MKFLVNVFYKNKKTLRK